MESSLDEFARTHGAAMLGHTAMGRSWKIQAYLGGGLLAVSAAIATLPLFGVSTEALYGVIGPGLAGVINLGIGLAFRKQAQRHGPEVELSDEARELLGALVIRAQAWQGGFRGRPGSMQISRHWMGHRPPAPPTAEAMAALERTATAYLRVSAVLGETKDERSARLRAAADAGMADALSLAATRAESMDQNVALMTELAERVEADAQRTESPSALRSRLDTTLEELRAEDEARQELKS